MSLPFGPTPKPPAANCGFARGCGDAPRQRAPGEERGFAPQGAPKAERGFAAGTDLAPQGAPKAERGFAAGTDLEPPGLPAEVAALVADHPCYSEEAHHHFARMHVAVAAACNIQCHYCHRKYDCASESRPGVVSERLSPEDAVRKVLAVAAEIPELAVVGIAGPGDALANAAATFATLEGIRRAAPDLTLCLSTNGLALPEHVDRLAALGVRHVTVTVNMTDPEVGERIYPWVVRDGKKIHGREASRILSERQLLGIARLRERGVLVKVNSVVIPGVNDGHLPEVARAVRAAGAFLVNLVPLISAPEHGTHYGKTGQRGPTAEELERVQVACELAPQGGPTKERGSAASTDLHARVMRHCRQCRADAVGRLAEDRFDSFTLAKLPPGPARDARELRAERREAIARARVLALDARDAALLRVASVPADLTARVAIATKGGGLVDQHFGHARELLVYDVARHGARLVARRTIDRHCAGGDGDDDALAVALRALADCDAVLVARVGHCPRGQLAAAGIAPVTEHAFQPVEAAALGWFETFAARVARGEVVARRSGPAEARAEVA
jgi:nitrogen fixation protein NifB